MPIGITESTYELPRPCPRISSGTTRRHGMPTCPSRRLRAHLDLICQFLPGRPPCCRHCCKTPSSIWNWPARSLLSIRTGVPGSATGESQCARRPGPHLASSPALWPPAGPTLTNCWIIGAARSRRFAQSVLQSLITEAVLRACVAHSLARELGSCSPRKCFLSGLLFDLPALVTLSVPARLDSHARLLSECATAFRSRLSGLRWRSSPRTRGRRTRSSPSFPWRRNCYMRTGRPT